MQCEACNVELPDAALHCENCGARLYRAKLRVSFEDGTTQVHHLFPNTYSIGRGEENDIVLADASVSRKHAIIEFREGGFVIRDQGSKNGSLLNGVHFTTGDLRDMDCIQLGQVVLHFFDEETSARVPEGFLGTEEFVQRAFFKFAGQNRTNLSKREAVETLLDLAATLIHADEVFLFHLDPAKRLQFELGRDRRGNPVAPESLPPESWECIHAAISSAGIEVSLCPAGGRGEKRIRCLVAPLLSQKVGGVLGVSYFGWEKGAAPPAEAREELLATLVSHLA
ncbi:MAG: FHA domain-containing protein, partial [Calditrichaeota bacterium]